MIDEQRLVGLLRSAVPPAAVRPPSRDLWPLVERRFAGSSGAWTWIDLGIAAATAIVLLLFPEWLLPLVFHL